MGQVCITYHSETEITSNVNATIDGGIPAGKRHDS